MFCSAILFHRQSELVVFYKHVETYSYDSYYSIEKIDLMPMTA